MIQLRELVPGMRFRQPATGLTGRLLRLSPSSAEVQLDRFRDIVIQGEVKARSTERVSWSLATAVEPLEAA